MGAHAVAAQPAGGRKLQHPRQPAIIGKQQKAFGIDIETADGEHARQVFRQIVEHGRTAFRIGIGRHQTGRLVIEPEPRALDATDRHAVHLDAVGKRGIHHRRFQHRTVEADPAFHDHPLDIAARRHTGTRQDLRYALGLGNACGSGFARHHHRARRTRLCAIAGGTRPVTIKAAAFRTLAAEILAGAILAEFAVLAGAALFETIRRGGFGKALFAITAFRTRFGRTGTGRAGAGGTLSLLARAGGARTARAGA